MVLFALIASLPQLKWDEAPFLTMEELQDATSLYLDATHSGLFRKLSLSAEAGEFPKKTLASNYLAWETAFRNTIARLRAARLNVDAAAYLHADGSYETDADRSVREAFAAGNPLEREKLLDLARWRKIEEFEFGNRFNFNVLCAYKLKLELLLKWKARDAERSQKNLDLAAAEVRKEAV